MICILARSAWPTRSHHVAGGPISWRGPILAEDCGRVVPRGPVAKRGRSGSVEDKGRDGVPGVRPRSRSVTASSRSTYSQVWPRWAAMTREISRALGASGPQC